MWTYVSPNGKIYSLGYCNLASKDDTFFKIPGGYLPTMGLTAAESTESPSESGRLSPAVGRTKGRWGMEE